MGEAPNSRPGSAGGMSRCASDPGLKLPTSGSSLRNAGAIAGGGGPLAWMAAGTTSLYEQMEAQKLFKDQVPHIRPAGRSITVPLADSAERDLRSDTYFPLPQTPIGERKFRKMSQPPGEISVHYGLRDQKLPSQDFRYGIRGVKGVTAESTLQAGLKYGIAAYMDDVAEAKYDSSIKEPLGKPYNRGHKLKMAPEGFGMKAGVPTDAKKIIFPLDQKTDSEEVRKLYLKSHKRYMPGERINRGYNMPQETAHPLFCFGLQDLPHPEGVGMAKVMKGWCSEEDGGFPRTRLVQKTVADYREVQHPKVGLPVHQKQGSSGPPVGWDFRHGVKSLTSEVTAGSCIKGYYSLPEQLADQDLGRCLKPGRRNVTVETRAFGIPSVRTDVNAPHPGKRSVADLTNYGDECGAAALLNPQRFEPQGISDYEFLLRRPKEELRGLVEGCGYDIGDGFEELYEAALNLFDDNMPYVSLDAILHVHTQQIEHQVDMKISDKLQGVDASGFTGSTTASSLHRSQSSPGLIAVN